LLSRLDRSIRDSIDTKVPTILENTITYRPIKMSNEIPVTVNGESFVYVKEEPVIFAAIYSNPANIVQFSNKASINPNSKDVISNTIGTIKNTQIKNEYILLDYVKSLDSY